MIQSTCAVYKAIYRNWKLSLTRIPNSNRHKDPNNNLTVALTDPRGGEFLENWH